MARTGNTLCGSGWGRLTVLAGAQVILRSRTPLTEFGVNLLAPSKNLPNSSSLLTLIASVIVIAALYFGRAIFIPIALAMVLTFLLTPAVTCLERCRLGRIPSVFCVLALSFLLIGIVSWKVSGQVMETAGQLPNYRNNIHRKIQSLRVPKGGDLSKAAATVKDLSRELAAASPQDSSSTLDRSLRGKEQSAQTVHPISVQVAQPQSDELDYARAFIGPLVGPFETAGMVMVFTLFMLMKREDLRNRLIRLAGQGRLHVMTEALSDGSQRLSRYMLLQFLINVGYGVLFGVGLYFIQVPHALLWGALAVVLRFLPYVGTLIATALPVALAVAIFPGWHQAILTFGLFVILEVVISSFVEPWLCGAHTGISSLAILVTSIFWAMLWGPVGLILSTPLTVCLILLGRYVPQLEFLEVILGDEPVLAPEAHYYQRLLALDQEEANNIAYAHLKEKPLGSLYDSVLIPALSRAEQDRHTDVLDEAREKFIFQSTRELIEALGEGEMDPPTPSSKHDASQDNGVMNPGLPIMQIACLPARDDADELAAMMLAQLLQRSGFAARPIPIGTMADMLTQVSNPDVRVVCVSALPPFALGQARSLCKRLRALLPNLRIILCLWNPNSTLRTQEPVRADWADAVCGTLAECMVQVKLVSQPVASSEEIVSELGRS